MTYRASLRELKNEINFMLSYYRIELQQQGVVFSMTTKFIECFGENTFQFVPHQVFIQASGRGYLRKKKVRRWQRARTNKTLTQRMSSAMITFRRYLQESVGDYRLRAIIMLLFLHST